jgi:hypothetical protein
MSQQSELIPGREAIMKRLLIMVCLWVSLAVPAGASAVITGADAKAIHETVQAQLDAFTKDDAAGAFELATQEKRMLIGSPDNFMRIIREQYDPIYRHIAVIFFEPEIVHGSTIQMVRVTDTHSRVWVAVFWMQQEEDHEWKIDGCELLETTSVSV